MTIGILRNQQRASFVPRRTRHRLDEKASTTVTIRRLRGKELHIRTHSGSSVARWNVVDDRGGGLQLFREQSRDLATRGAFGVVISRSTR